MPNIPLISKTHILYTLVLFFGATVAITVLSQSSVRVLTQEEQVYRNESLQALLSDQTFFKDPGSLALTTPITAPITNPIASPIPSPVSAATFVPSQGTIPTTLPSHVADRPASPPISPSPMATTSVVSPLNVQLPNIPPAENPPVSPPSSNPGNFGATVGQSLHEYLNRDGTIDWGISIRNAKNGELVLSEGKADQLFTAASTTKLLTAFAFLQKVEQEKYSLDDQIGAFPADFQLHELINQSDNDSWDLFNNLLGSTALEDYSHTIGAASYTYNSNQIKPVDMAVVLGQFYQGKILNPEHTKLVLSNMRNTEEERFLPSSVPIGTTVYHKIGLLDDLVHDVGIVEKNGTPLSVAIYSNGHGSQNYNTRALMFSQIGHIIFAGLQ